MKENLHNWIFTYNDFKKQWCATTRDNYNLLWNDVMNKKVLRSTNVNTLVDIIKRTNGVSYKIERLLS